jgi:hypothetical protein
MKLDFEKLFQEIVQQTLSFAEKTITDYTTQASQDTQVVLGKV